MIEPDIGRRNTLRASTPHHAGMLLDAGSLGEILLPKRYVPDGLAPGDEIEVMLSLDSEDRLIATTETPLAYAGEFAMLKVIAATRVGVFLDWGMPKDLLLPYGEQPQRVKTGDRVLVHIYLDKVSGRLVASAKLRKFLAEAAPSFLRPGNRVSLLLAERSEIGVRAIVNDNFWGLLNDSEAALELGTRCEGFVARIREDGLVDLSLREPGYARVFGAAEQLAEALATAENGFLPLHDKSPPEQVRELLGMSKKVFKQAAGALYKAGRAQLEPDGIRLTG